MVTQGLAPKESCKEIKLTADSVFLFGNSLNIWSDAWKGCGCV